MTEKFILSTVGLLGLGGIVSGLLHNRSMDLFCGIFLLGVLLFLWLDLCKEAKEYGNLTAQLKMLDEAEQEYRKQLEIPDESLPEEYQHTYSNSISFESWAKNIPPHMMSGIYYPNTNITFSSTLDPIKQQEESNV